MTYALDPMQARLLLAFQNTAVCKGVHDPFQMLGKEREARIDQSDGPMSPMASGYSTDPGAGIFHQEEERMLSQGNSETFCVLNGADKVSGSTITNGKDNEDSNDTYESGGNVPMNDNDGEVGGEWFGQGGDGNIQASSSELVDENPVSQGRGKRTVAVQCYDCTVCWKLFSRSDRLKSHMYTHTEEKPYKCGVCPKSFTRNGILQKHMFTHTGQKPYECTVCSKRFSWSSNLKNHMYTHWRKRYTQRVQLKGFHSES